MRPSSLTRLLPLALILFGACSDGVAPSTGPDEQAPAGFEIVPAGEIADVRFLEDLTDADRAAVREALHAARGEIRSILGRLRAGEIDRAEARALVGDVHRRLIETLSRFLTEVQIERLLNPPRGGPDLALTDEQRRWIGALREECRQAVARVREAVESGDITAGEGRRRVRRIAWWCRRELCEVFEPEQQAKVPFCRGPEDTAR